MAADQPDRDDEATRSPAEPDAPPAHDEPAPAHDEPASAHDEPAGQTVGDVPTDRGAETEIRPVPSDLSRPDQVGPGSTSVMPPVEDVPGTPRWSARASVRTPDVVEAEHDEWAEPPRSVLVPVLVTACILLLVALFALGTWLIFAGRPSGTPTTTPTVQNATPPATTEAQTPTSAARTPIPLPDVRGLDYETAAATLSALGFTPVRQDEINSEIPKGKVIEYRSAARHSGSAWGIGANQREGVVGSARADHARRPERDPEPHTGVMAGSVSAASHREGHQAADRYHQRHQPGDEDLDAELLTGKKRGPASDHIRGLGWHRARRTGDARLTADIRDPIRCETADLVGGSARVRRRRRHTRRAGPAGRCALVRERWMPIQMSGE